jgi:4-amino-4-deoxy-L-arabinose transferase-like glycosyltransferase
MVYWLIALKPETSADALSMHLALPMSVAHDHRWMFDFRQYTWALMPSGGDSLFTAAYLLGGETAARLTNVGLLVVIVGMVYRASRQWLAAALFASTPLVLLVTGSLFVENVWAAMIMGAVLALIRYDENGDPSEIRTAGVLFGAAISTKVIAAVFLLPAAFVAVWMVVKRRQLSTMAAAALLLAIFAAPPYAYAWVKARNPLFPFANAIFRSPYYPPESFADPRFRPPISWHTAYDATFRSGLYFEAQGGAPGFQYFLMLVPAAILTRRRAAALTVAIGAIAAILLFAFLPNLRYIYPALPLFSIAIGNLLTRWRYAPAVFCVVAGINGWFLASAGWYQKDFALYHPSQVPGYLESSAPERVLIDDLNRTAPGKPVAFFSTGAVAGLQGAAFTDSWHTNDYWTKIRSAQTAEEVAAIVRGLQIHQIVAPVSLESFFPLFETFLREWAEPSSPIAGSMGLFTLRDSPMMRSRQRAPFLPGTYDDMDRRIEYTGAWVHDPQFVEAANGSLTYCVVPGASLRLEFVGSGITYRFTKASNRGIAQVSIDGAEQGRIDMYSREKAWHSERTFGGMPAGKHVFEVQVLSEKNPESSGTYVDLDSIAVQ